MTVYGYGRVSKDSQVTENQQLLIETTLRMPLDKWYEDHAVSGSVKAADRKNFSKMLEEVKKGDTIVFSRVDRIGRKTSDILNTVEGLLERGIEVYILQIGNVPLSSPMGKVILGVFAIFAENDRLSIIERTNNGIAVARKNGVILGAKLKIHPDVLSEICQQREDGVTLEKLSERYGYDKNTISVNYKKWSDNLSGYAEEWNKRDCQYKASVERRVVS